MLSRSLPLQSAQLPTRSLITVKAWQQRPLDSHYPFVWFEASQGFHG